MRDLKQRRGQTHFEGDWSGWTSIVHFFDVVHTLHYAAPSARESQNLAHQHHSAGYNNEYYSGYSSPLSKLYYTLIYAHSSSFTNHSKLLIQFSLNILSINVQLPHQHTQLRLHLHTQTRFPNNIFQHSPQLRLLFSILALLPLLYFFIYHGVLLQ